MAVFPQNELDVVIPGHPSCQWTGARLWNFTRNYLSRDFSTHGITAELWMGTYNISDSADDLAPWLYDSLNRLVRGAGFQWGGYTAMGQMLAADSSLHLRAWETENMCHTGANSWTDAMDMYCSYMYPYFQKGANSYQNWNMILNVDPAFVPWIPRYQNSMITITSSTGTVTYNPEFFVMKHFSYYIKQGAVRMPVSTGNAALWPLAFKNPDGTVITLIANSADTAIATSIQIGNSAVTLTLPAGSINTFDMGGTEDTTDWVPGGTAVRLTPQSGSTRAVPAAFTIFDIAGRIIRQDVTGRVGRGATTLHWDGIDDDGRRVARGVYFAAARGAKTASRLFFTGNDWAVLAPATR